MQTLSACLATGQIKTGAPCRSERLGKDSQLLRVEEELGSDVVSASEGWQHTGWESEMDIA